MAKKDEEKKDEEKGEKPIKHTYRVKLTGIALINFALYYLVVSTDSFRIAGLSALLRNWAELIPGGGALIVTGTLNALLDSTTAALRPSSSSLAPGMPKMMWPLVQRAGTTCWGGTSSAAVVIAAPKLGSCFGGGRTLCPAQKRSQSMSSPIHASTPLR